jgi:DNA gyrase subunit A
VIAIQTSARNGELIGAIMAKEEDDVMLISNSGTLVRTPAAENSTLGRNTQGVRVIRLADDEQLVGLAQVQAMDEDENEL